MITYKRPVYKYRIIREPNPDAVCCKIMNSSDVAEFMRNYYYKDEIDVQEKFFIILLNNALNTVGVHLIGIGGIAACYVDVRIIAKYSLEALATQIILIHNHPSGSLQPSTSDKILTSKIKDGLKLLDIKVNDHVIITETSHFSFADEGLI